MSLSAKKYFGTLRYIDCNDCEFYHAEVGHCEKVGYKKNRMTLYAVHSHYASLPPSGIT